MPRVDSSFNEIAILATGDELTHGDILNTNSQIISQKLFNLGMRVGLHMVAPDNMNDIQESITFLLNKHRALIITGGLGPTSDDITRYALSKAIDKPLIFDEPSWQIICERIRSLGYKGDPPEGNKQQALFPEGSTILANPNGTAAGCQIEYQNQHIFMLPGPPTECLPMVDNFVINTLTQNHFQHTQFFAHWFLFGASEGVIAEKLDELVHQYNCTTGYRLFYPYIEFKILTDSTNDFNLLLPKIEEIISPFLLGKGKEIASSLLQKQLTAIDFELTIFDLATGGLLEHTIKTPQNYQHILFNPDKPVSFPLSIHITGLKEFWEGKKDNKSSIKIKFSTGETIEQTIPLRGDRVKLYAVEWLSYQIYQFLNRLG